MKDIFDFRRFGKYFVFDLNNAWNSYGISGLITALSPIEIFTVFCVIGFLRNGHAGNYPDALQMAATMILVISLVISFTAKAYGNLTEKRFGSDWILIPASGLEKTLSMILVSCLVVPLILGSIYLAADWLLSVLFNNYPSSLIGSLSFNESAEDISLSGGNAVLASWWQTMMSFVLGAIYFKKAKAGKTILTIFGVVVLLAMTAGFIINGGLGIDSAGLEEFLKRITEDLDAQKAARLINVTMNTLNALIIAILGGLTYLRVRTMKH